MVGCPLSFGLSRHQVLLPGYVTPSLAAGGTLRVFLLTHQLFCSFFFFFQAEDGIRDHCVTGVQTCALPIWAFRSARRTRHTTTAPPTSARRFRLSARQNALSGVPGVRPRGSADRRSYR